MNITYDYYRIFYYVAKYHSFTQAANILFSSQPNVTRAIKNLENELGCTLFVRSNKRVELTPEGEALYEHISLAFEHIQAGEEEISQKRSLQKGVVSIGATEIALRCFLLPILNEYRRKYPAVKIKISNLSTPQALSSLKNGLVDFAVVTTPAENSADMHIKEVKSFREIPICGEAYSQIFVKNNVGLVELTKYPIASLGKGRSTFAFYTSLFASIGAMFSPDIEAATTDQILPLVKHNLGIGFVPEEFLAEESGGVFRIHLDKPIPERKICVATLKGRSLSLPAKKLNEMMIK